MAILMAMSSYSVAEAKNNLPKLLDRMLAGEEVVITRRGKPIARLTPEVEKPVGFKIDVDWLEQNRVRTLKPTDAVETIRELRDGYRY
ncbi:type II toxin-antitoxin system Phd/YefM family antitoxin [Brevundimonas sp.]|jgi:prevent-host-death family protein|uniref:type II toxin-antitoxin system Phd/YefM family antitoxin n=1 Tax=Brevundimonas sp. TaxID=1871086 RepID=UPI0037C180E4